MAALAVVEDLDEVEDRRPQARSGRPGIAVEELVFEGGEEALGDRVVEWVADGPHRGDEVGGGQAAAVGE